MLLWAAFSLFFSWADHKTLPEDRGYGLVAQW
jgi:hypothetical protein